MSRHFPVALAILLCLSPSADAGVNVWTSNGPFGGFFSSLAVDPQDPGTLYAGTFNGRVFKSTDGGASWTSTSHFGVSVESLVVDSADADTVFAGTPEGVFRSADGGASWMSANVGLDSTDVRSLATDPTLSGTLYASTGGGVFLSEDAADSWTPINSGLSSLDVRAVTVDPQFPGVLYAATADGVFKSVTAGFMWSPSSTGLPAATAVALVVDPLNTNTAYVVVAGNGVFKSTDAGASWTPSGAGLPGTEIRRLAVHLQNPNVLYAATLDGVARTADAGVSWELVNGGLNHVDIRDLAVDPTNGNTLYAATFGGDGLFRTSDAGATWTPANAGLAATLIEDVAVDPIRPAVLYATATFLGVFKSIDGGANWQWSSDGLASTLLPDLAIDPLNPNTLYAGTADAGVFKSTDAAVSWTPFNQGLDELEIRALAIHPGNPNILYAATAGGAFKTFDAALTWSSLGGLSTDDILDLAVDPVSPSTVYAATGSGVLKSVDAGATWDPASTGLGSAAVQELAIDPLEPDILYAVTSLNVFSSTTAAETWHPLPPVRPGLFPRALAIDPLDPRVLYTGTTGGVARSTDRGASWTELDAGLPAGTIVEALALDPLAPDTVYAGTFGNAVLELTRVPTTLGDFVWLDADADGLQDPGEEGVAGVEVRLMSAGTEPELLAVATTDNDGRYRFEDLEPGDYLVEFVRPEGFRFTLQDAGNDDAADSDVLPENGQVSVGLEAGQANLNVDAGLVVLSSSIGDFVWLDADADGLQDPEEEGVAGVPVTLFEAFDLQVVATTTTDVNGRWQLGDLAPGRYLLEFTLPEGFRFSPPSQGDDDFFDSDVNPGTGTTPAFSLSPGESDPSLDAGIFADGSIGNLVWRDENGDGVRDPEEPGFAGVTVRLLDALGEPIDSVRTTQRGRYLFAPLVPGRYAVEAVAPEGFIFSPRDRAPDDLDSDADPATGRTAFVELRSGEDLRSLDIGLRTIEGPSTTLLLRGGRFEVEVDWRDFRGQTGAGTLVQIPAPAFGGPLTLRSSDSALLQFFSPDNWELLIKVLDGRDFNDRFWVFLAAATDVEYVTTVTDTACGTARQYVNRLGRASPAVTDTSAFPECGDPQPPSCVADDDTICLGEGGRFQVELRWRDFQGDTGVGRQVFLDEPGVARSDDSGLFYFFSDNNWEMLVKVLDGCALNGHFWVFAAATTDVEYTLRVTDTRTGTLRTFSNPLGRSADALNATMAFPTCDAP